MAAVAGHGEDNRTGGHPEHPTHYTAVHTLTTRTPHENDQPTQHRHTTSTTPVSDEAVQHTQNTPTPHAMGSMQELMDMTTRMPGDGLWRPGKDVCKNSAILGFWCG